MDFQNLEENRDAIIKCALEKASNEDCMFEMFQDNFDDDTLFDVHQIQPPKLMKKLNSAFDLLVDLENRLMKHGFSPEDHHGQNIGYRGNHLVILDLGAISR